MFYSIFYRKYTVVFLFFSVILLTACDRRSMEGMLIITVGKATNESPDYISGKSWRYLSHTGLMAIDPDEPGKLPESLSAGFFSACSPEVSYDGTHLLFAAQKGQDDPWQIWEMDLGNLKTRQVTNFSDNSIDPAYLPGDRIVFSRYSQNDSLKAGHTLFTCNLDGTDIRRITFNPHAYFASTVLKDGRILTIGRQIFPEKDDPFLMVLRPDGTKAELFYKGDNGSELFSRGWETENGKIVFIEAAAPGSVSGNIISINYNRPLHTGFDLTNSTGGYRSVFPLKKGNLLVSYRPDDKGSYKLFEFDAEKMAIGSQIFASEDGDILEAVEVTVHERPRKLPSEVDLGVKTGLLLCQNINVTGMMSPETGFSFPHADRIEIMGIDSSLGVIQVEEDGSVYLKVAADMPFRIKTLNKDGYTVNGPGSWYWLRPNERRGCIGCHEDNEMVPANRYASAVSKDPVSVPVHVTGVKEKEVELE
jgi:hypothetical protein